MEGARSRRVCTRSRMNTSGVTASRWRWPSACMRDRDRGLCSAPTGCGRAATLCWQSRRRV